MPPKPKGSRKSAQNHDRRHENGLALPERRVHKSRSNGTLNGHAASHSQQHPDRSTPQTHPSNRPSPDPHPSSQFQPSQLTGRPSSFQPADDPAANGTGAAAPHMATGAPSTRFHAEDSPRSTVDQSLHNASHTQHRYRNGSITGGGGRMASRKADAGGHAHRMATGLTDVMQLAATIVASCPLCDVIAMLIILLQLPPTILTIVDALFAVLTFVPPATGASLSALPSLSDMFQGSGGQPSLWTVAFLDVVALFGWAFLWLPAQSIALDLAQAVIAISLGGAAAGRGGTMHAVLLCVGLILPYHALRYKPTRQFGLKLVSIVLTRAGVEVPNADMLLSEASDKTESAPGVFQNVVGVHILTQGVTRLILRALSHRESTPPLPPGKRNDPEAAGASRNLRANSIAAETTTEQTASSSTDGRPPGPSPAPRDGKEKASQARRKKRRSAHVRSQQPFWAALASGKVTFSKQKEQNQANVDALEANASDNHVGNANFGMEGDRVWITDLGPTEISFGVSMGGLEGPDPAGDEMTEGLGIDRSKPFYVRVNGAVWSSTRTREKCPSGEEEVAGSMWEGEIFGLTALSNYFCEFVRTSSNSVIHSASLVTSPAPSTEQTTVVPPHGHQSLRPSSPTTTLKNSIAAAEQKLQEHRNRQKRNRKEHNRALAAAKKEVDSLRHRLNTSGGSDDKQRQRALQFNQNVRQAEDVGAELAKAIEDLGEIPESHQAKYDAIKKRWRSENERKSSVAAELDRCKAEAEQRLATVRTEIASTVQKRERLIARQNKLAEQHEKLASTNAQELDAKAKRDNERAAQTSQRATVEQQFQSMIAALEAQIEDTSLKIAQAYHQVQQFDLSLAHAATSVQSPTHSIATATEGVLPGSLGPSAGLGRGNSNMTSFHPLLTMGDQFRNKPHRSSSMLSDISGFTDELAEATSPPMVSPPAPIGAPSSGISGVMVRKGSKGSNGSEGTGPMSR